MTGIHSSPELLFDLVERFHDLAALPARRRRDRSQSEERELGRLSRTFLAPCHLATWGQPQSQFREGRRWARFRMNGAATVVREREHVAALFVDASATGFRIICESELVEGEAVDLLARDFSR